MRTKRSIAAWLALLCACTGAPEAPVTTPAVRFRSMSTHGTGRWSYLVFLPDAGVYCSVVWLPQFPLRYGSNPESPHAFAFKGTLEDAFVEFAELGLEDYREAQPPGEEIRIPLALAREIVDLADLQEQQRSSDRQLAMRWFDLGLFPGMMDISLVDYGVTGKKGH